MSCSANDPVAYGAATKKVIRSVLLSHPRGLILEAFRKEYIEFEGRYLDYCLLGYDTVLDYFRSIPDTVQVEELPSGDVLLKGVADQTTCHVADFVRAQKNQKGGNRATQAALVKSKQSKRFQPIKVHPVPPQLRQSIQEVLKPFKEKGVPCDEFPRVFQRTCGCTFDFLKLGYSSPADLLDTIKDMVEMKVVDNVKWVRLRSKSLYLLFLY